MTAASAWRALAIRVASPERSATISALASLLPTPSLCSAELFRMPSGVDRSLWVGPEHAGHHTVDRGISGPKPNDPGGQLAAGIGIPERLAVAIGAERFQLFLRPRHESIVFHGQVAVLEQMES